MEDEIIDSLDELGHLDQIVETTDSCDPSELTVRDLTDTTLKEIELEKPKRRKQSSNYRLSLTTTMHNPRFYCSPSSSPIEEGGLSCKKCKGKVDLDDYVGIPESGGFKCVGYHCHNCDHRWLRDKYREEETKCKQSYMTKSKWEIKRG